MNPYHSFNPYQHNQYNQQPPAKEPHYRTQYNSHLQQQTHHDYLQHHPQYFSQRRNTRSYTQEHEHYYTQQHSVQYHSQSHQQYLPQQQNVPRYPPQKGLNSPELSLEQRKEAVPPYDATRKHHPYTYSAQEEPRHSFTHFASFRDAKPHADIKHPPQPYVEYPAIPPFRSASPSEQKAKDQQEPVQDHEDKSDKPPSARRHSSSSHSPPDPEKIAPPAKKANFPWVLQGKYPPPAGLLPPKPPTGISRQTGEPGNSRNEHKRKRDSKPYKTKIKQPNERACTACDSRQDISGEKVPSIKELGLPQRQELTSTIPPRPVPHWTPINVPYKYPQPFASAFPPIRMPNYVVSATRGPPILGDGFSQLQDELFHEIMSKYAEHRQSSEDTFLQVHKPLVEDPTLSDIGTILLGDCLVQRFAITGAKTTLGRMHFPEAFNAGVLGDKIANVLFRLENMYDLLKERRVKNWIILAGTNDMTEEGISRGDWERLKLLLWAVLRLSKTGKGGIFVCGLFGRSDVAYEVTKMVNQMFCDVVADFNDWIIKQRTKDYRRIIFVPPPEGINRSNMYNTCLPDAEGYKIWDRVLCSEVGVARSR